MGSSLNVDTFEGFWEEVYNSPEETFEWAFTTKKEAERMRFRALGYTRAVRHALAKTGEKKYFTLVERMNKREHLIRQVGENEWKTIIRVRANLPMPTRHKTDIASLDYKTQKIVLGAKDENEVTAERLAQLPPEQRVLSVPKVKQETVADALEGVFEFTTTRKPKAEE